MSKYLTLSAAFRIFHGSVVMSVELKPPWLRVNLDSSSSVYLWPEFCVKLLGDFVKNNCYKIEIYCEFCLSQFLGRNAAPDWGFTGGDIKRAIQRTGIFYKVYISTIPRCGIYGVEKFTTQSIRNGSAFGAFSKSLWPTLWIIRNTAIKTAALLTSFNPNWWHFRYSRLKIHIS